MAQVIYITVGNADSLTAQQIASITDQLLVIGQADAADSKKCDMDPPDCLDGFSLDAAINLAFTPAVVAPDFGVLKYPNLGADFVSRAETVLGAVYGQLATDSDLESVTAAVGYKRLTNMLAVLLDEMGSSMISSDRRHAYQAEAASAKWAGIVTPVCNN